METDVLISQARAAVYINPDQARQLANQAAVQVERELRDSPEYPSKLVEALSLLGIIDIKLAHFDSALAHLTRALSFGEAEGPQDVRVTILKQFGIVYTSIGDYPMAIDYLLQARKIAAEIGLSTQIASCDNNIGYCYILKKKPEKSLPYLQTSLRLFSEIDQAARTPLVLDNLCLAYTQLADFETAIYYGEEAVRISSQAGRYQDCVEALVNLGNAYLAKGELRNASDCFQQSLAFAARNNYQRDVSIAARVLGECYLQAGQPQEALRLIEKSFKIAQDVEARHLAYESCQSLAKVYERVGDYQNAIRYLKEYHRIRESVFKERADLRVRTLEVIHQVETARKEAEIFKLKNITLQQEIEERKKVQEALEILASTDPLTGLYNRRYFISCLETRLQNGNQPLAILLIDVDHFKEVNDRYGHGTGDEILVAIAALMGDILRKTDVIGRYGGEEFMVLMDATEPPEALQLAERLRQVIAAYVFQPGQGGIAVTISCGVAFNPGDAGDDIAALFQRADDALYIAKKAGRNRTIISYG